MDPKEQLESLHRTLAEEEGNLLLIEEQKAKYVLETDIPVTLIKEERRKQKRIEELKQRIEEIERSQRHNGEGVPDATTEPPSAFRSAPLEHITHIGSVTGPVHTGSGDIVIVSEGDRKPGEAPSENLRENELAYLDGLLKRYEYWRDHYTPLAGIAEVRAAIKDSPRLDLPMPFIPPEFGKLVDGLGPQAEVRREPVDDLRRAIAEHRRIILLGDPGSGKTTTLWRLAYDYATVAREDAQAPLPLLVPLGGYTDDGPFDAYLTQHLGPLAPYLEVYRASGRLILLLDGLNEMPRADYTERVGRIQDLLDQYLDETAVVTCRALDYVVELKQLQKVEVSPLDETRVRGFLRNYLGETSGERLLQAMEQTGLKAFGRNPYLLLITAQVYAGAKGKLPANRAKLFGAYVDTLLEREKRRHSEDWIEIECQMEGLSALAYAMQSEPKRGTTVEREWAMDGLGRAVPGCDAERLLYLASSATLLDEDETTVRFYHQLLQEYFAACHVVGNASQGTIPRLLSHCADDHWREVILLTASLLDVADDFFVAFQYALDDLVCEDTRLVKLLDWATRKSATVTTSLRRAALRSAYCQIALAIARGHTLVESGDIGYSYLFDRTRDQAKALADSLGYDHDRDRVPSLDLDLAVSYALTRALTCARPIVRGDRGTFVAAFSKAKAVSRENKAHDLYQALSNLTLPKANRPRGEWIVFSRNLESAISSHRDVGQGWRFTREQTECLERYLHATQLFVRCLDLAHITDRTAVEDRLLLPPDTQDATVED